MICPRCDHDFSLFDSFSILNPYDFGCPHCSIRLSVGEKGEIAVRAAILLGIVLSLWAAYLSRIEHLPHGKVLAWLALVLIGLAIPIQWATIRFADVQLYDRKRDYDW